MPSSALSPSICILCFETAKSMNQRIFLLSFRQELLVFNVSDHWSKLGFFHDSNSITLHLLIRPSFPWEAQLLRSNAAKALTSAVWSVWFEQNQHIFENVQKSWCDQHLTKFKASQYYSLVSCQCEHSSTSIKMCYQPRS